MISRWFAALSFLVMTGAASARQVTVDDLMRLRTIVDARISPDGAEVAYVVSEASFEKDAHEAVLYLIPYAGGSPVRLTEFTRIFNRPLPRPQLRWSPDGAFLSFLAWSNELPQVVALPLRDGGEARVLTSATQGVSAYEWSPDGNRIAFLSLEPPSAEEERLKKERAFVIEVDRRDRPGRVWVQDALNGPARAITPLEHFVAGFTWSPDATTIAYAAAPVPGFTAQFHTRIYTIPASGGAPRPLVDRDGMNTDPQYSPDGKWIAFRSTDGKPAMISIWGLHVAPTAGGPARNLSAKTGSWVGEFLWEPTSASLLYVPNEGTAQRGARMFEQPITRVSLDGETQILSPDETVNFAISLSRDGRRMAFRSVLPRDMGDLYVLDLSQKTPKRLTEVNPTLKELDLGKLEAIHWTSFDGMEIWGLLLTPPRYQEGAKLPLVVYVHGGPIGGFTYGIFPQFMHRPAQVDPYPAETMAGEGMAILFPMPRGGSGYGLDGFRMIVNAWGEGDYRDIMAGVDHLISKGIADPDRLGVMGASYGGYMTDWIVTQTDRFKAASSGASICDLEDLFYLSDAGDVTTEYFGLPWEKAENYRRHSAITYVENVKTPLLLQHGEMDMRTPVQQAKKFYQALKRLGKTVELEILPRGGHVNYEPDLEREQMRRNLAWFRRWLKVEASTSR